MRNRDSFQESLTVNCFFTAKDGELHQTITRKTPGTGNGPFDERRNLIAHAPTPQEKFVKFFTISARLMDWISFVIFAERGKHPISPFTIYDWRFPICAPPVNWRVNRKS